MLFTSIAHAQDGLTQSQGSFASFVPLILIVIIFYFLIIRPQQKKFKNHQSMVGGLKRNDQVVTAGGVVGTVTKVGDDGQFADVEIAKNVVITIRKSTILEVTGDQKKVKADSPPSSPKKATKKKTAKK